MADSDQFLIELGITEAGTGSSRGGRAVSGSGPSSGGARAARAGRFGIDEGSPSGGRMSRGEARAQRFIANRLFEDPAKAVTRYAIGETLAYGFTSLIPNAEQNAFTEVGKIAGDIGMRSLFLNSLKGGAIIGGLAAGINLVQRSIEQITTRIATLEKENEERKRAIDEARRELVASRDTEGQITAQELKEIREKLYASSVSPF